MPKRVDEQISTARRKIFGGVKEVEIALRACTVKAIHELKEGSKDDFCGSRSRQTRGHRGY